MRFWDFSPSPDLKATASRLRRSVAAKPTKHAAWAVLLKRGGRFIGMVNYHHREPWNRRLEVGYILARPYWRKGYMGEAMQAFLQHCFDELDVHRVEASIEPDNAASRALVESLGFACESAPLRDRIRVEGKYRDVLLYGLLASDWATKRRRA